MYSPTLGRWISQDPIGFIAGDVDLYRFVGNDPVGKIDPSGLSPIGTTHYIPGGIGWSPDPTTLNSYRQDLIIAEQLINNLTILRNNALALQRPYLIERTYQKDSFKNFKGTPDQIDALTCVGSSLSTLRERYAEILAEAREDLKILNTIKDDLKKLLGGLQNGNSYVIYPDVFGFNIEFQDLADFFSDATLDDLTD